MIPLHSRVGGISENNAISTNVNGIELNYVNNGKKY